MKISQLMADPSLSTDGVDVNFGEPVDGEQATLRIAYGGNNNFRNKLARLTRRAASQMTGRDIPPETAMRLNREAMAGTILVGWSYLRRDDDSLIEYSEAEALKLLDIPAVWDFVQAESSRLETFQKEGQAASDAAIKSVAGVGAEARSGLRPVDRGGGGRVRDAGAKKQTAA
jgi:hypothetical protein